MNISKWKISYTERGVLKHQNIWWRGEPSEPDVAAIVKARVLRDQRALIPELNEDVLIKRYNGIEIVEIGPADESVDNQRANILVVDDNKDSRETLADVLRIWNHSVAEAEDGPTCLKLASTFAPDVILLDIGMPHMDGFEVARQLRQLPELARTRIIAVSAYGSADDKQKAARAGFDEHFTKPVALDVLRGQLFPKTAVNN